MARISHMASWLRSTKKPKGSARGSGTLHFHNTVFGAVARWARETTVHTNPIHPSRRAARRVPPRENASREVQNINAAASARPKLTRVAAGWIERGLQLANGSRA